MKLLILALIVLITWELYDRVKEKLPEWVETIKGWLGIKSPSRVYMDDCHAGIRRPRNKLRFLRELEDFCRYEGLDLKVWEDLEFDALGIQLHDRKTNRALRARIKREDYESTPIASANRIKRAWEGGTNG